MTSITSSMTSPSAYSLAALQNYLAQGANTPTAVLVDRVKDETGIVPSHLAPLQDIAMTTNSIIGIRPVETVNADNAILNNNIFFIVN